MAVLYAYVGWVDRCRRPQIYFTDDLKEAEQGLMRVELETYARTRSGKQDARDRAREDLLDKWHRQQDTVH